MSEELKRLLDIDHLQSDARHQLSASASARSFDFKKQRLERLRAVAFVILHAEAFCASHQLDAILPGLVLGNRDDFHYPMKALLASGMFDKPGGGVIATTAEFAEVEGMLTPPELCVVATFLEEEIPVGAVVVEKGDDGAAVEAAAAAAAAAAEEQATKAAEAEAEAEAKAKADAEAKAEAEKKSEAAAAADEGVPKSKELLAVEAELARAKTEKGKKKDVKYLKGLKALIDVLQEVSKKAAALAAKKAELQPSIDAATEDDEFDKVETLELELSQAEEAFQAECTELRGTWESWAAKGVQPAGLIAGGFFDPKQGENAHSAAYSGKLDDLKAAVAAGADVNARDKFYNETPLHVASNYDKLSCVEFLASQEGILLDAKNHVDETPLMKASSNGSVEVVRALLAAGADKDCKDSADRTAVDVACQFKEGGDKEALVALLQ